MWAYEHRCLSAAALQAVSRGSALRLIPTLFHKSLSHHPFLSHSLSLFRSHSPSIYSSSSLSPTLALSLSASRTFLPSLTPLCLDLSTTDYLARIQNVIKENDQLPQLPSSLSPSFLPSALFLFLFFFRVCLSSDPVLHS